MADKIPTFWKAIYAGVFALGASLVTVLVGDFSFGDVTDGQWVAVVLSGLGAFGGVYGIRNGEREPS